MKCSSLSASKITTYKMCAFKFYLTYHLGLDLGKSFAAENGSLVHRILEKFAVAKKDNLEDAPIHSSWVDIIRNSYKDDKIWKLSNKAVNREKQCIGCEFNREGKCFITDIDITDFVGCPKDEYLETNWLVEKIIKDKTPTNPLTKKVLDIENRFKVNVKTNSDEITINGVIDLVHEIDNETIEITDWKTGNKTNSYEECLKDPQFLIYHLVSRQLYPQYKNVIFTAYYLKKQPISFAFTSGDEKKTKIALAHYYHAIKNNKSPLRIADRADGSVVYNYICRYMCNSKICEEQYEIFKKQGSIVNE